MGSSDQSTLSGVGWVVNGTNHMPPYCSLRFLSKLLFFFRYCIDECLSMDDNPFPDLHIDDLSVLDAADSKVVCPSCGTKRRYFCYSCILFVNDLDKAVPVVKVIKYPRNSQVSSINYYCYGSRCDALSISSTAQNVIRLFLFCKMIDSLCSLLHHL